MGSFDFDRRNSWSLSFTSVLAMAPAGQGTAELGAGGREPAAGGMGAGGPGLTLFALLLVSQDEQLLLQPLLLQLFLPLLLPLPLQLLLPLGRQHLLLLLQGRSGQVEGEGGG